MIHYVNQIRAEKKTDKMVDLQKQGWLLLVLRVM